jgi:hypothetical protein
MFEYRVSVSDTKHAFNLKENLSWDCLGESLKYEQISDILLVSCSIVNFSYAWLDTFPILWY